MREVHEGARMSNLVLASILFASIASAAIDGTVVNGTSGKPQSGATVTLYRVGQNGPESLESVKTDAQGKFTIQTQVEGPRLLQSAYDGVTYNRMLPPGFPSQNLTLSVYESSKRPGQARVDQHMMFLEPANGEMNVGEIYVYKNDGKTTYNDPDRGTLQFYLPEPTGGKVMVNVQAPQGMPIRRAADKTSVPNVYKIDFPIKPGETRIDLSYAYPFTSPGVFNGKVLYKGGATRIVAPAGVTIIGPGLKNLGQEPRTQATIYGVDSPEFRVQVEGTGALRSADATDESAGQPSIAQILPKLYNSSDPGAGFWGAVTSLKWILLLSFAILGLGFVLLYRARAPEIDERNL
ncbi:MAG: hypothetical protein M3Z23_08915 [Acidobacteriota bacterium]|nr:hypothetical protein [Acidobacteriota bacterium]